MNKIRQAIESLRETLRALEPYEASEAVPPKPGRFYETFNGSAVYILYTDSDNDGKALVLKGGHKVHSSNGEEAGETYYVDSNGYYKTNDPGAEMGMSLIRELPIDLDQLIPPRTNNEPSVPSSRNVARVWTDDDEDSQEEEDTI
ncbi:MAG: hypothetical protein N2112_00810 [Gemmataceae bacterium]|jgi:hypothetical protein|nr:hypothetical protein [Gemmataceae bacterium]